MLICIEGWEFVSVDLFAIIYFAVNFVHFGEFIRDKSVVPHPWRKKVSTRYYKPQLGGGKASFHQCLCICYRMMKLLY